MRPTSCSRTCRTSRREGRKSGSGAPGPREHPHVDPLGEVGKQIAEHGRVAVANEREAGAEVPAGQVDVRSGLPQLLGDRRQRLSAVDQNLDGVAGTRRRVGCGPATRWRVERVLPADPAQAPPVVATDLPTQLIAEPALGRHGQRPQPRQRPDRGAGEGRIQTSGMWSVTTRRLTCCQRPPAT